MCNAWGMADAKWERVMGTWCMVSLWAAGVYGVCSLGESWVALGLAHGHEDPSCLEDAKP